MAQLDFFLSIKDREIFIDYCFNKNSFIIPHLVYQSSEYITLKNLSQYKECELHTLFSIANDSFFEFPLRLDFTRTENTNKYFIMQREGGPTIDFFSPVFGQLENNIIGPGFIGIYPYYYNKGEKVYASAALKECYADLVKFIKRNARPVIVGKRKYWIGLNAIKLCHKNKFKLLQIGRENILIPPTSAEDL